MTLSAFILALMIAMHPDSPFRASYERSADAIAKAATRNPLFSGADGVAKTAYLVVAVAEFESSFQADAEGDCDQTTDKGICLKGSTPHSFCFLQVSETNFKAYRTTREEIQTSIDKCVTVGLAMMKQSFAICRSRAPEDRLAWYAGGGPVCPNTNDALKKSRHRYARALWLFQHYPPSPVVESEVEARE